MEGLNTIQKYLLKLKNFELAFRYTKIFQHYYLTNDYEGESQ